MGGHGWVNFSLDGTCAWCHTPDVFDAQAKKQIATLKDENGRWRCPWVNSSVLSEQCPNYDATIIRDSIMRLLRSMTHSWFFPLLLQTLLIAGCDPKKLVKDTAKDAVKEEVERVTDRVDELKSQIKTIDIGSQQAQQLLGAKLQEVERLAEETAKLYDVAKMRSEETGRELQQAQQKIEAAVQETKRQLAKEAAKRVEEQNANEEHRQTMISWLRSFLLLLGIITAVKIFGKPLWRVIQTILLRNFAPAPRRIFKVSAK